MTRRGCCLRHIEWGEATKYVDRLDVAIEYKYQAQAVESRGFATVKHRHDLIEWDRRLGQEV